MENVNEPEEGRDSVYEFRWDVEVPQEERRYGEKFRKQWRRILQAQKLLPLVSAGLSPCRARFQVCVTEEVAREQLAARQAEVMEELAHLRWSEGGAAAASSGCIAGAGEPAGRHPAGWQGVRVWMSFPRRDVETALAKKPRV